MHTPFKKILPKSSHIIIGPNHVNTAVTYHCLKNNNILTFVSKDKGLLIGLVFSLVTHLFLFTLFPSKEDKLLGDKYIPIEIVDIKSPIIKGDSINESEKTNNENNKNNQGKHSKNKGKG